MNYKLFLLLLTFITKNYCAEFVDPKVKPLYELIIQSKYHEAYKYVNENSFSSFYFKSENPNTANETILNFIIYQKTAVREEYPHSFSSYYKMTLIEELIEKNNFKNNFDLYIKIKSTRFRIHPNMTNPPWEIEEIYFFYEIFKMLKKKLIKDNDNLKETLFKNLKLPAELKSIIYNYNQDIITKKDLNSDAYDNFMRVVDNTTRFDRVISCISSCTIL